MGPLPFREASAILYSVWYLDEPSDVVVQRLGEDRRHLLYDEGVVRALHASSGHIVLADGDVLRAAPFDADRLEIIGDFSIIQAGVAESSR